MPASELFSTPLFSDGNLNAYYRFSSNSNDSTANSNNGTDTNMTYGSGQFGNAAQFNGTNAYISVADSTSTSITGDMTIHCWVYISNVTTNARGELFAKWQSSGNNLSFLLYQQANSGRFTFNHSSDGSTTLSTEFMQTSGGVTANTWTMLDFVKSGTTGTFYLNGSAVSDNGQTLFSTTSDSSVATYLGVRNDGGLSSYWAGNMDDLAFFSRALTPTEISNLYNGFPVSAKKMLLLGVS